MSGAQCRVNSTQVQALCGERNVGGVCVTLASSAAFPAAASSIEADESFRPAGEIRDGPAAR